MTSLRPRAADFGLTTSEYDLVVHHLQREPNELEAAMFGALWSEHCGYKHSKPLLKTLPTEGPHVLQGPGENAGVVDVGDGYGVAFKVESHNSPTAVRPFSGAATGVGGILRDIFAMGARPFAVLGATRFGELTSARNITLMREAIAGMAHYANTMGIPTVGGELDTHRVYDDNPLVNVMALGLLKHEDLQTGSVGEPGNILYYVGAPTGRDGLGGAVFSSAERDVAAGDQSDRTVQRFDAELERRLMEACLEAIKLDLVVGIQDMGAAGLTSSVGEMAYRAGHGVDIHIEQVPMQASDMTPSEVMLSETQERMVLTIVPDKEAELLALFERWDVHGGVIGEVNNAGRWRIYHHGELVADVPVNEINEAPTYTPPAEENPLTKQARESSWDVAANDEQALLTLLSASGIASKAPVYRQFNTPADDAFVTAAGRADAAILRIPGTERGVAASIDCNQRYVYLNPELGAAHAVAEATRNVSTTGAKPVGITDNFNFGSPEDPHVYYEMREATKGIKKACEALHAPVTGGNVSLYNQYKDGETMTAIYPTPTIGAVGVLENVDNHATMRLQPGDEVLCLIGPHVATLGASEYLHRVHHIEVGNPPPLDLALEYAVQRFVRELIASGTVVTAHDVSEGGLAVALAEMQVRTERAIEADLTELYSEQVDHETGASVFTQVLFGEAASRIIIALPSDELMRVMTLAADQHVPLSVIGRVTDGTEFSITAGDHTATWAPAALRAAHFDPFLELFS